MSDIVIPVFIINLETDELRRDSVLGQFAKFPGFMPHIVSGCPGRLLAETVCVSLSDDKSWAKAKGTIGCFLSHVRAWEAAADCDQQYAIIIEDDVDVSRLHEILDISLPDDAELIFVNNRVSPNLFDQPLHVASLVQALKRMDLYKVGPGGDGYVITPAAAKKLVEACLQDLYYGHVDGRLLRYATNEMDLQLLPDHSWISSVIRTHHHPLRKPVLGLVKGYCLSYPLVTHRGVVSSREHEDSSRSLPTPARSRHRAEHDSKTTGNETTLPIRYWDRVSNIGDLINPYVIEAVSGRRPMFSLNDQTEHLLGIGSILFMATESSHIWGSGLLDPKGEVGQIDLKKVHALRGKLSQEVLRKRRGLAHDVPLGDPGIFIGEIPEVEAFIRNTPLRRRVALIPHYALADSTEMSALAKSLDADIISPKTERLDFIRELIASEIIISQSLHGLIFSEVLGKPSAWISQSVDEKWTFKFHDWFSNTDAPPTSPLLLNASPRDMLGAARLSGLHVDRAALRNALPQIAPAPRSPGYGFRKGRDRSPLLVRVANDPRIRLDWKYDYTLNCDPADERSLQQALNSVGRNYDEPCHLFLISDVDAFSAMTIGRVRAAMDLLTRLPVVHFLAFPGTQLRSPEGNLASEVFKWLGIDLETWKDEYRSSGFFLIRHPSSFSFSAPGRAVFFHDDFL